MPYVIESRSPSDPSDVVGLYAPADARELERAVARACAAFPDWRDLGAEERARRLRRFRDGVARRADELARLITREVGKALWDARGEAALVSAKVDVTLEHAMRLADPIEAGGGARATFHPRGVLAVLGPFNFPAHLPNGHLVPALAAGNAVILKPSELAPVVGDWLVGRMVEAGIPDDVVQVVHGGADVGRALALHDDVDGILFTGSWAGGRALSEASLDQPNKILALEMGGKNAVVVLDDADLDLSVAETALSMCATTGQRCSSASRLFVDRRVLEPFVDKLVRVLRGVVVGDPLDERVFMGPLVSPAAFDRVEAWRQRAAEAGGERILGLDPGRGSPFVGPGLVRFAEASQAYPYQREEIFGPEAAIYPVDDLDEAIAAVNDSDYGLVASIMTASRARWEHCIGRVHTGLLNWNRGTIGASGRLPFGGLRRSGNDRPAGISATLYCTTPQAHLERDPEADGGFDPSALPPGMPEPK